MRGDHITRKERKITEIEEERGKNMNKERDRGREVLGRRMGVCLCHREVPHRDASTANNS
jgi:hypothetical protein